MSKVFYWIQLWWLGRPLKFTQLIVMVHYHAGGSHWKMGTLWSQRYEHGRWQYSDSLWYSNHDELALRSPNCAQKNIRHTMPPTPEIGIHRNRQHFFQSSTVHCRWVCAQCGLRFLFLTDRRGTQRDPLHTRLKVRRIVHYEMLFCSPHECVSELLWPYCRLQSFWPFSFSHRQQVSVSRTAVFIFHTILSKLWRPRPGDRQFQKSSGRSCQVMQIAFFASSSSIRDRRISRVIRHDNRNYIGGRRVWL